MSHRLYWDVCERLYPITGDEGNGPRDFENLAPEEREVLRYWIQHVIAGSRKTHSRHSYGLKHDFEYEAFYITNGQFKGAMLLEGYEPVDIHELNWNFKIKQQVLHQSGLTHIYYDHHRFSLGRFDKDFATLLFKAGYLNEEGAS